MVLRCATLSRWHRKFSVSAQMSESSRKTVSKLLVDCSKWLRPKLQSLCCGVDDSPGLPYQHFHGVGRPQMSSTGKNQDAVVGYVRRGETAKTLTDDHGKFEQYLLPDRKPMKVVQYRCYVVKLPGTSHNTCRRILDRLKLFQQIVTDTIQ